VIVHSRSPYNAEPSLARLRSAFITEASDFYVRCHGAIPDLDEATHRLRVDGRVVRPLDLSLPDLKSLAPCRDVHAVMQCAGNRRADLQPVAPTTGDPWQAGAIGHAVWTGLPLADLLRHAGAEPDAAHIAFESADELEQGTPYGASIPSSKARDPDVLLAWAMNGAPLRPEHGFPLRLVVPGYAGVRSPKWLRRITVGDHPSSNPIQSTDYRLLPPDVTPETVDWNRGLVINELPINAAICEPSPDQTITPGALSVRGYAICGTRTVERVDVSADGGRHWQQAELERAASPWSWTFWTVTVHLDPGNHELVVRAWDSAGQTQPARPDDVWNFKGYLSTAWHRVPLAVRSDAD
jgi:sulfite oxidase